MAKQCLKNKAIKRGLFTNQIALLSISLLPVWIVLFVKNIDIPIHFGHDWQFVGWGRLLSYKNFVAVVSSIMTIIGVLSLHQLRHRTKGSPDGLTTTVTSVSDRSLDYVNTLATIVTLIGVVLVPVETLRSFLIFAILMTFIIVCYLKTNLYYSNPIFAALGFRLYTINGNGMPNESIVIYRGVLNKNMSVTYYHISDKVYYLICQQKNSKKSYNP